MELYAQEPIYLQENIPRWLVEPKAGIVTNAEIGIFLKKVLNFNTVDVYDHRFASLKSGSVELIAAVDFSGRSMPHKLVILSPEKSRIAYYELNSAPPHYLPVEIVDCDGDGLSEIIVREYVASYAGAETTVIYWASICRLSAAGIVDVSEDYQGYYERWVLPQNRVIQDIVENSAGGRVVRDRQIDRYVAACRYVGEKYARMFQKDREAGLSDAIAWSGSGDNQILILAVKTLREIGTSVAVKALEELVKSKNALISKMARDAVTEIKRK